MNDEKNEKKESRVNPAELPVPEVLSVLPLHEFVFYPGMGFPLQVSSASSKQLIDDALLQERMIAIVSHKKIEGEQSPKTLDTSYLFSVGVVGYIHKINKTSEEIYQVLISASKKIRILEYTAQEPYLKARVEIIEMKPESDKEVEALVLNLRNQFKKLTKLSQLPPELLMTIMALTDPFFIGSQKTFAPGDHRTQ
jgi:ATP-dependent Lon protease